MTEYKYALPKLADVSMGFELGEHIDHLASWATPLYDEKSGNYGDYYVVTGTVLCHDCRRGFKKAKVTGKVANRIATTLIMAERARPPRKVPYLSGRIRIVEGREDAERPWYFLDDPEGDDQAVVDADLRRCATPQRSGELVIDVDAFEDVGDGEQSLSALGDEDG